MPTPGRRPTRDERAEQQNRYSENIEESRFQRNVENSNEMQRMALRGLRRAALSAQRKRGDAGLMISIGLADPEEPEEDDEDEDDDEL